MIIADCNPLTLFHEKLKSEAFNNCNKESHWLQVSVTKILRN